MLPFWRVCHVFAFREWSSPYAREGAIFHTKWSPGLVMCAAAWVCRLVRPASTGTAPIRDDVRPVRQLRVARVIGNLRCGGCLAYGHPTDSKEPRSIRAGTSA